MPKGAEKEIDDLMLTCQMKARLGMPDGRALADFLPTITIKAKDFANEITNFNIKRDDLRHEGTIYPQQTKEQEPPPWQ
jgi:DNA-damage-inducible protein D